MKHARKALALMILLVTPLLLAGVISPVHIESVTSEVSRPLSKTMTLSYEDHALLNLDGDDEFRSRALNESWDGDGSELTPYIIEGYNFSLDTVCITLTNISVYFEIRDCFFSSATVPSLSDGLQFVNVTHASIVDSIFEYKSTSIWMIDSHNAIIDNCTIRDGTSSGVYIGDSNAVQVNECDISSNSHNIRLSNANDTVITNNDLHDSIGGSGINLYESHFAIIEGNEIFSNANSGIKVIVSDNCTIENNVIYDNWYFTGPECGIYLDFGHYATIVGNEIHSNAQNGIFLTGSDWVYIFGNNIYNNSDHGIDAVSSDNGTIIENDVHGNGWWPTATNSLCGVYLGSLTQDWIISENMIWNNTPSGISMEGTSETVIFNNDIFNNTDQGVSAALGSDLVILENQIHENGWQVINSWDGFGIMLAGNVVDSRIEGNEIFNNTNYGIYGYGQRNEIIGNEVYNSPDWGIGIAMATNYTIDENIVYNNAFGIFSYSHGTIITDNIIFDNDWGIHLYGSGTNKIFGNDIGWNTINAQENVSQPTNMWYDNVTDTGNWWSDYSGTGFYDITNTTHTVHQDLYPSKSLDLVKPASIEFEILQTGNVIVFEASALNPSHYGVLVDDGIESVYSWDGGNIEYLADGLSHGLHTIVVEVYHISGHYLGNSSTADVEDLTHPTDIVGPSQVTITFGDSVSTLYSSSDPSGVEWTVDNTEFFAISSSGLLTNIANLTVGVYNIQITALDPHGHSTVLDVTVVVNAPTDTGLPTTMILVIGAGGALVVVIVFIVVLKKKGT